jgi:hypothetical protein
MSKIKRHKAPYKTNSRNMTKIKPNNNFRRKNNVFNYERFTGKL